MSTAPTPAGLTAQQKSSYEDTAQKHADIIQRIRASIS